MNALQRAMLESDLRARGQVSRSFAMRSQEPEALQLGLGLRLAAVDVEPRTEPPCDHADSGREAQSAFDGVEDIICTRCGAIAECNHCSTGQRTVRTASKVIFECELCGATLQEHSV